MRRTLTAVLLSCAALLAVGAAASAYEPGRVLFTFADERIEESSGLVASSVSDGWVFTHNDSGDEARFYVVDRRGRTLARHTMPGVDADDWEDIARGPDEKGRSSLWLGDIGDNAMMRPGIVVYRVPEPAVDPTRTGLDVRTPAPSVFRLRYEDVPHDAEALLVHPRSGQLFVVTKTYLGQSSLYAAPQPLRADAVNTLTRVADLVFTTTGTPGGAQFGPGANLAVTGGDIAPSGDRVALRTYTDLYEWALPDGDVAAALQPLRPRVRTPLPATVQGEAVGYTRDGRSVLVSTEGVGAPVHLLAEAAVAPVAAPASPAGLSAAPAPAPVEEPGEQPADAVGARRGLPATGLEQAAPALGAAVLLGVLLLRRHRLRRATTYAPGR